MVGLFAAAALVGLATSAAAQPPGSYATAVGTSGCKAPFSPPCAAEPVVVVSS